MAEAELIQALDYILNRSDEASIEVLAQAVIRRRRDIAMFGALDIPDPQRMAKDFSGKITAGIGASIEGMKRSVREMAVRIIREQAPELSDEQVEQLTRAWIPQRSGPAEAGGAEKPAPQRDLLACMIEQFVEFSRGMMKESIDKGLREELGAWPERYWKAFPPVIRLIISDFLKDKISEEEFNSKIGITLDME
jgi:hypothetical protein